MTKSKEVETEVKAEKPSLIADIKSVAEKHGAKVGVTARADGSMTITVVK